MHNSHLIFLLVSILVCSLLAPATAVDVDPDTGCPIGVSHKCEKYCIEDGCLCTTEDGDELVTGSLNTPCPIQDVDPCAATPCANGAACIRKGLTEFTCNCTAGFGGQLCDQTLAKCGDANVQCPNGQCVDTGNAAYPVSCKCADNTQRNPLKNETCPSSPCYIKDTETPVCQNGGSCYIANNAAACQCIGGWAGPNCTRALKTPLCESKPTVCGSGRCYQTLMPPRYICDCGNYPNTIAKELNEVISCEQSACYMSNPCQHGGTCSNKDTGFACLCPPQYTGFRCEKQSACFNNPCLNRGTCQAFNETAFVCSCPAYYSGQICEISIPNPCNNKNCGAYGECQDINGVGVCFCSDGPHNDGSPCQDPCVGKNCNGGVCQRAVNASYQAYCSCPLHRSGENCEDSNDVCRQKPPCGGGFCRPNYSNARKYECVCLDGEVRKEPCPFAKITDCMITTCGTRGVCVRTNGLMVPPNTLPVNYVCSCENGFISSSDCNGLLTSKVSNAIGTCGGNGRPYPSRNPENPIGCWCNNGTHVEELNENLPLPVCG